MVIREFLPADYDAVLRVWTEAGLTSKASDQLPELEKKRERDPDLFLVAEADGRVVGAVIGAWDGRRGWIYHLAVLPAYQGQGIGRRLMGEVEQRLKQKGCLKVNLHVERRNAAVAEFYRELGYAADDLIFMGKLL